MHTQRDCAAQQHAVCYFPFIMRLLLLAVSLSVTSAVQTCGGTSDASCPSGETCQCGSSSSSSRRNLHSWGSSSLGSAYEAWRSRTLKLFEDKPGVKAYYEKKWKGSHDRHNGGRRLFGASQACTCKAAPSCWKGKTGQEVTVELFDGSGRTGLSANADGTSVSLWTPPHTGDSERWLIDDKGTHAVLRMKPVSPAMSRVWMTAASDGTGIHLASENTAADSHWVVKENGAHVHIRTHSDAQSQSRVWLRANSDGTAVDLSRGDVGARGKWKISCV